MIGDVLALAAAIVARVPAPDPELRRARVLARWRGEVARLEALPRLSPAQSGRLAKARAMVEALSLPPSQSE